MKKRIMLGSALGTALMVAVLAATVGGAFAHATGATPLPAATCSGIQNPSGNLLVASDLPLQGSGRSQTIQMTKAVAFVMSQHGWKAGKYTLAYQSCDDATAQAGKWDSGACSTNANAYASDASVVGVIGTFNSGCSEIEIPIENRAPNGPLIMVSPANTYVGLTHVGPGTAAGEPNKYYPTGKRNYARVVAADDFQGAADATFLKNNLHVTKLFVLNDKEAYGIGVSTDLVNSAKKLGITVVKNTAWDPKGASFAALALQIKASGAQAVFLGGLVCEQGGKLIKDIRAGAPNVIIDAPDGFTPISADVQGSGGKAEGMYVSVAGLPNEQLPAAGKAFLTAFSKSQGGAVIDPYAVYAAQAAEVVVEAIRKSDGTRAGVAGQLFKVNLPNSILGNMFFNANGDVSSNPVTEYKIVGGKSQTAKVIIPAHSLVAAA